MEISNAHITLTAAAVAVVAAAAAVAAKWQKAIL